MKDHYDGFLGPVYSWILGDFDDTARRYEHFFRQLGLSPHAGATAVDLGCGSGSQAIPLARIGYDVLAIDFCEKLLAELADHSGTLPVRTVRDDLALFRQHLSAPADLIVCMGDTLVHLPDEATVLAVLDDVCRALKPSGKFIYAIRDYAGDAPRGAARFVPVRSTDDRIFTCFLDYGEDTVHVHDILYARAADGWTMSVSDYRKLRLAAGTVDRQLELGGLSLGARTRHEDMIVGVATRPA